MARSADTEDRDDIAYEMAERLQGRAGPPRPRMNGPVASTSLWPVHNALRDLIRTDMEMVDGTEDTEPRQTLWSSASGAGGRTFFLMTTKDGETEIPELIGETWVVQGRENIEQAIREANPRNLWALGGMWHPSTAAKQDLDAAREAIEEQLAAEEAEEVMPEVAPQSVNLTDGVIQLASRVEELAGQIPEAAEQARVLLGLQHRMQQLEQAVAHAMQQHQGIPVLIQVRGMAAELAIKSVGSGDAGALTAVADAWMTWLTQPQPSAPAAPVH